MVDYFRKKASLLKFDSILNTALSFAIISNMFVIYFLILVLQKTSIWY